MTICGNTTVTWGTVSAIEGMCENTGIGFSHKLLSFSWGVVLDFGKYGTSLLCLSQMLGVATCVSGGTCLHIFIYLSQIDRQTMYSRAPLHFSRDCVRKM